MESSLYHIQQISNDSNSQSIQQISNDSNSQSICNGMQKNFFQKHCSYSPIGMKLKLYQDQLTRITMTNLTGMGTSRHCLNLWPSASRTKATMGLDKHSIAPQRVKAPSTSSGIRFKMGYLKTKLYRQFLKNSK